MAKAIPNNGRAVMMRNRRTGAAWLVSFDYRDGSYWHEPQGNLRHIRRPYASRSIEPNLVPAGTHYQTRHTYACWSLSAGANPNFIATQMGHADAQMVYKVYGKWMAEKNTEQVALLNQKLADFAPSLPHDIALNG